MRICLYVLEKIKFNQNDKISMSRISTLFCVMLNLLWLVHNWLQLINLNERTREIDFRQIITRVCNDPTNAHR